ncbi:MAG: hypothetical protein LBS07_05475 [Prevotellaceae bacterium]|jgi:hypothetical protein|nr:hypothetical protein [Prevotellaceae bacterium]
MALLWQILFIVCAFALFLFIRRRRRKPEESRNIPDKTGTETINKPSGVNIIYPSYSYSGNPEFHPRKHPVMTYGAQRRQAKRRKKQLAKQPK